MERLTGIRWPFNSDRKRVVDGTCFTAVPVAGGPGGGGASGGAGGPMETDGDRSALLSRLATSPRQTFIMHIMGVLCSATVRLDRLSMKYCPS